MSDKHVLEFRQGDDTDFLGRSSKWVLPDYYDYSGWKARYSVGTIHKNAEIQSETVDGETKYFVLLVLTAEDTAALPEGIYNAALKLWDGNNKCETVMVCPTIKILPQIVNNQGE